MIPVRPEVCGYSVMSNHLHLVLRNRPDIAEQRSADEIALRILLYWTGRELRAGKHRAIPDHLAPIVEGLGINRSNRVETVRGFGRLFKQAAGRSSSLVDAATRRSRRWFRGKAAARTAFV